MARHYHVDLRSFPEKERERLYECLDAAAFLCNPFLNKEHSGIYDVIWNYSESIEEFLQISSEYVIPQ